MLETRIQALERRLREAEEASRRKSRMLASLSHDLRSPLQAITAMAEVIHLAAQSPQSHLRIPGLARRLEANALSMVEMLSEVIDASAFESGHTSVKESDFPLDGLLNDECRRLLALAQAKGLRLTVDASQARIWLRTDRTKLARIVGNLLGNAIKFTSVGEVRVGYDVADGGEVLIAVKDTGPGIDAGNLKKIFDEFAQVQGAHRNPAAGWGLGLPICRRLVQLIGGAIGVESRLGEGSVFTVRLPRECIVMAGRQDDEILPIFGQ